MVVERESLELRLFRTAVGINYDINESIDEGWDGGEISSCNDDWTSPLCVPQDRLEDIKFHKDFNNDLILLPDFSFTSAKRKSISSCDDVRSSVTQSIVEDLFSTCDSLEKPIKKQETKEKEFGALTSNKMMKTNDSNDHEEKQSRFIATRKHRSKRSRKNSRIINNYSNKTNWDSAKRKCYHCLTESTPQWRMGPKGPKTLCNACGVRYKAGKLLPEYRPASSPTFDGKKHSNFHKRVLQRRFGNINLHFR